MKKHFLDLKTLFDDELANPKPRGVMLRGFKFVKMKDKIRTIVLLLSGFLTLLLMEIFPVAGGGESMIILLTIPFLFLLAVVFGVSYYSYIRKRRNEEIKTSYFLITLAISILMNFVLFPYA